MAPSASPIPGKPPVLLVSACLAGEPVRYNNTAAPLDAPLRTQIHKWITNQRAIALCPEIEGGLSCPRPCAEIRGKGGGHGILTGEATIVDKEGNPLTRAFLNGCRQVTKEAVSLGISIAFLKEQSPSCGVHRIYDGWFYGNKKTRIRPSHSTAAKSRYPGNLRRRNGSLIVSDGKKQVRTGNGKDAPVIHRLPPPAWPTAG